MNSLVELESCVDPCVDLLLKRLDEQVSTAPPALAGEKRGAQKAVVDLTKWLHFFAMDAVGELAVSLIGSFLSSFPRLLPFPLELT